MFWKCCGRTYANGVKTCKVCGQGKVVATTDGKSITVKREETPQQAKKRKQANKTARIVRAIPVDDEQFYTSTMPGGPKK
jgi:hypothetical protein